MLQSLVRSARRRRLRDCKRGQSLMWERIQGLVHLFDHIVVTDLSSASPDIIDMRYKFLVLVRWHEHSRHLRVAIESLLLGRVVPLQVQLELNRHLHRAQVCLRLDDGLFALLEVIPSCDFRVEWLDRHAT